jgi:hypothetical protein
MALAHFIEAEKLEMGQENARTRDDHGGALEGRGTGQLGASGSLAPMALAALLSFAKHYSTPKLQGPKLLF